MTPHIPLKGSTAGRQYAGWQPRAVAMNGLGWFVPEGGVSVEPIGAFCAMDVRPRSIGRQEHDLLADLASWVQQELWREFRGRPTPALN